MTPEYRNEIFIQWCIKTDKIIYFNEKLRFQQRPQTLLIVSQLPDTWDPFIQTLLLELRNVTTKTNYVGLPLVPILVSPNF